jgi:hypothetical protein
VGTARFDLVAGTGGAMGEMFDWQIRSEEAPGTPVTSTTTFDYKLRNRTYRERLAYGERRYGINLVWVPTDLDPFNVRIVKDGDGSQPLVDGDSVAIGIDDGGYLRRQSRDYGINLVWSDSPVYEWEVRLTERGDSASPITTELPVGLFNVEEDDFLFYDPRQYGIDLKWLRDEGKFNGRHWWEKVGDAIAGGWSYLFNAVKEFFWRVLGLTIGLPEFILSLFGIYIPKKMRIKVMILRDVDGKALFGDEELPAPTRDAQLRQVQDAVDLLTEVFKSEANINVIAAGKDSPWIEIVSGPAPSYALQAPCGFGFLKKGFYSRAATYWRHVAFKDTSGFLIGYAQPITAIVIKDITGKRGCSLGPLTSYLLIDKSGFSTSPTPRASTLTHEMGHQNGLWHVGDETNLMFRNANRGTNLSRWQIAWIRNSRFVTFL